MQVPTRSSVEASSALSQGTRQLRSVACKLDEHTDFGSTPSFRRYEHLYFLSEQAGMSSASFRTPAKRTVPPRANQLKELSSFVIPPSSPTWITRCCPAGQAVTTGCVFGAPGAPTGRNCTRWRCSWPTVACCRAARCWAPIAVWRQSARPSEVGSIPRDWLASTRGSVSGTSATNTAEEQSARVCAAACNCSTGTCWTGRLPANPSGTLCCVATWPSI